MLAKATLTISSEWPLCFNTLILHQPIIRSKIMQTAGHFHHQIFKMEHLIPNLPPINFS
jgi:hypothetical protein